MKFELPPLPYAKDALEPHLGAETLELHYEKHHRGYLTKLEKLLQGKPLADRSLVEIIRESDGAVFNNAAQVWNHTFYWNSMAPKGGGTPGWCRQDAPSIPRSAPSTASATQFVEAAVGVFGTGWTWLVQERTAASRFAPPRTPTRRSGTA